MMTQIDATAKSVDAMLTAYAETLAEIARLSATKRNQEAALRAILAFPGILSDEQRAKVEAVLPARRGRKPRSDA
jgi:hypothetical protein